MEKEPKICSFFGHRSLQITEDLQSLLFAEIMKAVDFGCRVFLFGGFGEFDSLCYKIVSSVGLDNPKLCIKRIFCVPQERNLKKPTYLLKREYEDVIFIPPSFSGWYKSIYFRNCAMIDKSDYVIFYAERRESSGAYKAYKYAKAKKNKILINIFDVK